MRLLTVLFASFVLLVGNGVSASAQVGESVEIDSALCVVEPLTMEDLTLLLPTGTPVPPAASAQEFVLPEGEPADPETIAVVAEFVYQLSACNQSGNILATFALQSDGYTRGTLSRLGYTEEQLQMLAGAGTGGDTGMTSITTINDVVVLEDGRIGVSVTDEVTGPALTEVFEMYYFLVESDDGGYLLDEYELISVQ